MYLFVKGIITHVVAIVLNVLVSVATDAEADAIILSDESGWCGGNGSDAYGGSIGTRVFVLLVL